MGPSRKRPRTKPPVVETPTGTKTSPLLPDEGSSKNTTSSIPAAENINHESFSTTLENVPMPLKDVKMENAEQSSLNNKSSWYGTWPRKSTASTQIAKETILADKVIGGASSADLARFEPNKPEPSPSRPPPSLYIGKSKGTLDVTMGGTLESESARKSKPLLEVSDGKQAPEEKAAKRSMLLVDRDRESPSKLPEQATTKPLEPSVPDQKELPRPATSNGWLTGWMGKPAIQAPTVTAEGPDVTKIQVETSNKPPESVETPPIPSVASEIMKPAEASSASWFGLWSKATAPSVEKGPEEVVPIITSAPEEDTVMEDAPPATNPKQATGSTWAFWSTDSRNATAAPVKPEGSKGELAVVGQPSENKPEPTKTTKLKDDKSVKPNKRGRPLSVEADETPRKTLQIEEGSTKSTPSQSPAPSKLQPPNLLIPSVKSTYRLVENPSILQQIARLLLKGQQPPAKHVFLVKDLPKIKNALAIGIHGLFPAPLLRTVIGQPTGTSIKFANHAADAIRRWADAHGSADCEIEKVALEGEGKIADRVDNLWKLLLNWIEHVRKADFIMIGCHSQGVPVAVMLVAKLVEFGVVSNAKIGICAMAGVSLGPFSDYKSRLFSGSAGELFEFANPESAVSIRYEDSLRVAMKYGTRITYCGSIDDQLISLESAVFSTVNHPYIFRAVFVDGRIHAPDFLSHLVGFALKLRNLGVSDHGLIRELSAPLAGSLYTGEGHSRLYDDGKVYDLAIEFALETTSVGDVPLQTKKYEIPSNANPYVLPWIMRGLLEEDFVKTDLDAETTELLKQFDDWKPATKVLKDVKYRLEAVRSKL